MLRFVEDLGKNKVTENLQSKNRRLWKNEQLKKPKIKTVWGVGPDKRVTKDLIEKYQQNL